MAENVKKKLMLKDVRLSFPSLWATEVYKGNDTGKFAASFLIPKDSPQGKMIASEVRSIADQQFGKGAKKIQYCLKDGDSDDIEYDGYAGHWAIKANTKYRPTVIDGRKNPIAEEDDKIYAGCYVNASLELYGLDNQWGKRVSCQLNGVQFVRDGDSFGGGGNAADDFDVLEETGAESDVDFEDDNPFS